MAPCPWALQAINSLRDRSDISSGVHLTVICDADNYGWGPITSKERVSTLIDRAGNFYGVEHFQGLMFLEGKISREGSG